MAGRQPASTVHWIDHIALPTNDLWAWRDWGINALGANANRIGGLTTQARKADRAKFNQWFDVGPLGRHLGAFLQPEELPASKGLGKDLPRYGFFIRPDDIDKHLRRLDQHQIPHLDPIRTSGEGDDGTAIYFEDPDGNQFELWAPMHMPDGAMEVATAAGVGRISSATYGSRNLQRTADFFDRFCDLQPIDSNEIAEDTIALALAGGGRIVYHLVDEVDERVIGHEDWYGVHAALTVPDHAYLANYRRLWDGVPEEPDANEKRELSRDDEDALPARTGLHTSPGGKEWKEKYGRGDEFYDWDGHAFHFTGGVSLRDDGSLGLYRGKQGPEYLQELLEAG